MTDDPRVDAFVRAERAHFDSLGLTVRERFLEPGRLGVRTRVLESGDGQPVLLVHGGGGLGAGWAPLMAHLGGFRLLSVDRPGFGLTGFADPRPVGLRAHALQFLGDVADGLALENFSIIANSMGALWSLWFASEHPDRVSRLALLGTPAAILDTSAPGPMKLLAIPGLNRLMMALEPPSPGQVRRLWQRMGHDPETVCTPEMIELIVRLERLPDYPTAWLTLLETVFRFGQVRPGIAFDETQLAALRQDVLFVWGSDDPFGSLDAARRATAATPHAKLEVIGKGHLPWLDEPEACAGAIEAFLAT